MAVFVAMVNESKVESPEFPLCRNKKCKDLCSLDVLDVFKFVFLLFIPQFPHPYSRVIITYETKEKTESSVKAKRKAGEGETNQ